MEMVNRCHGRQSALKWVDAREDSILGLIDPGVKVRVAIVALQSVLTSISLLEWMLAWLDD
jgi:hypothetical protein